MLKGRSPKDISAAEKQALDKLESAYKSLDKLQKENRELSAAKARRKVVDDIVEKELKIEALTGTFGPERLPPKG
jgi:transcriptional regulator